MGQNVPGQPLRDTAPIKDSPSQKFQKSSASGK